MNTTQISPSVESHTEEPLWQEFTEQEQEKICGGSGRVTFTTIFGPWRLQATWRDRHGRVTRSYQRSVTRLRNGSPISFGSQPRWVVDII
ncbi:MAG: hypothetical protein ABWU13_21165 [Limnospira maxima]|uniref:Uncharacterized protein n=1 Tax=Limnospira indica PCC 8005 TaxID=376219 RepID=A0A9P1NW76_9CYAN|nr:hypothetical protein [Limnospira indica]CDM92453.1 hypothetical protein ARTHRO_10126 [Limnospira indica PCC 8005]